ncbi:putative transcription factor interactor and regulator CCHC(Zn) family [Helianthus debilis subsp. tardiflorus]
MSEKKIIAICQSGGVFQTEKDGSMTYSGGEAYAVDLDTETKVIDFKQDLAETFGYNVDNMLIKYFLPGNKKTLITISKDKDLKRMINFFSNADQVDVFVMPLDGGTAAPNVSNTPASRSSRTTVSEAVVLVSSPVGTSQTDNDPETNETNPLDIVIQNEAAPVSFAYGSNWENEKQHNKAAIQWENTITGVEQRFSSFAEFREALHKFSIAHGFRYKYKKSDSHRVSVKCKAEGCPWRIYVSRLPTTHLIRIKKMNPEHTCNGVAAKAGYRATKGWVGNIIKEKLKATPNYKPKDIVADIKREYGVQLNYSQAWRAKGIAKEQLQGSYKEAYSQLPFFCQKTTETNPGSLATFDTKEDSSFHRFFVSFHASISGFQHGCRPLIFLDDIPLDAKYQGTLLIATAADGDDGVFPLAFAVVDDETDDDNWFWFLSKLKSAAPISQPITLVANFTKGLKDSIANVFGGECFHAYCLRYIAEKLNDDLKGRFSHEARRLMVQDLYAAAYAPKLEGFEQYTQDIKAISPEAYDWVVNSEPQHWANVFFDGTRYNHMTSNFGQLFYDWVSDAVELPITHMIDVLRGKLMELIYTRRVDSNRWTTTLTPSMEEKLKTEASKAQSFQVFPSQNNIFEVHGDSVEMVDISQWDCSCKGWQLTGLPCCHAIAVFEGIGRNVYDYCSRYFMAESYRKTYAESIFPIPDVEGPLDGEDISVIVTPPPAKRAPGKPGRRAKLKQAGSLELIRRQMQCSKCRGLGHNKKTCKEGVETHDASSNPEVLNQEGVETHEASSTPEVLPIQMDEDTHR